MKVTVTRTGARRYGIRAEPPGFPAVEMNPAPSYDADLPHDVVHFVVEEELGLSHGVFGQLAQGGDAGTFHVRQAAHGGAGREQTRMQRRARARGGRLARVGQHEVEWSERAATIAFHDWLAHADAPARRERARAMRPYVLRVRADCAPSELAELSENRLRRIRARLDELSAEWSRLRVGEALVLEWTQPGRSRARMASRRS